MIHEYKRRIYYGDTDKMGVAYYANYLVYYEEARTEFFRDFGYPYTLVEEMGIYLPVIDAQCSYFNPIRYDDQISVYSWIYLFKGVRIGFRYEIKKESSDDVIATGQTVHAFIHENRRPARIPDALKKVISDVWEKDKQFSLTK